MLVTCSSIEVSSPVHFVDCVDVVLGFVLAKEKWMRLPQRALINRFRQTHLSQQANERNYLDHRKEAAAELDEHGQPKRMLLFPDGMTQYTCKTPQFPYVSKGDKFVESRI